MVLAFTLRGTTPIITLLEAILGQHGFGLASTGMSCSLGTTGHLGGAIFAWVTFTLWDLLAYKSARGLAYLGHGWWLAVLSGLGHANV